MKKKKTWTKFRHWLIKKLGGYTTPLGSVNVCTSHKEIITLETCITVSKPSVRGFDNVNCNNIEWFKNTYPFDVHVLEGCLADKILELNDDLIEFTHEWDPIMDRVVLRARIRIAKNG